MYVIAASPLAKIFQSRQYEIFEDGRPTGVWTSMQKECIKNPELITSTEPFDIYVDRPCGGMVFKYNVPKDVRDIHGSDERSIARWLTGGPKGDMSNETDEYGIVMFDANVESMQTMNRITQLQLMLESASEDEQKILKREQKELMKRSQDSIGNAVKNARQLADARVKKVLRVLFTNMKSQIEHNKDNGRAAPSPSNSEYLAIQVLEHELNQMTKDARAKRDKVQQIIESLSM